MKSVEFLIALALLLGAYASLYRLAAANKETARLALEEFSESIRYRGANSLINNVIAYGEPFEYKDFSKLDLSRLEKVRYDPVSNRYAYMMYPRW